MKFKEAQQLGRGCGLATPAEWIWNVINHAQNLFVYTEMNQEIEELLQDAQAEGIDLVAIKVLRAK